MLNWFKKKDNSSQGSGADFSAIDSQKKALKLFQKGDLAEVHLMPLEFGGEDGPHNIVFAPEIVKELKQRFDSMIEGLLIDGKQLHYTAQPQYKGKSFIPSKLKISVTGDSEFEETINIW